MTGARARGAGRGAAGEGEAAHRELALLGTGKVSLGVVNGRGRTDGGQNVTRAEYLRVWEIRSKNKAHADRRSKGLSSAHGECFRVSDEKLQSLEVSSNATWLTKRVHTVARWDKAAVGSESQVETAVHSD